MKTLRILSRNIRDSLKSVFRNFSLSLASISCITITLIVVSVSIILSYNVNNFAELVEKDVTIVTFLNVDITEEGRENVKTEINKLDNIDTVTFESKTEISNDMMESSDVFKGIMENWTVEESPIQDTFLIKVKDIEKIGDTAKEIEKIDGVNIVKYGEGMVEQVISVFDIVQKIVVVVVIALVVVTSFLISNTIKLTIFSRRNEIEIMRLVGASNITIKLPFLFEGFIIGLIGSIIPVCITIYGYVILYSRMHGKLLSNMIMLIKPYPFVFWVSLIVIAIGALVGMYGSIKAVRKYLKV